MDNPSAEPGDERPPLARGHKVGRYEVIRPIGRGGMGEVYLAEDTLLRRKVALKRVSLDLAGEPGRNKARLLEEAQRASSLSGGRIAGVYDLLDTSGDQVLVMEYIPGRTLREIMDRPLDPKDFWDIAIQCAEALQAAHREGLVHRDIKPDNIILTPAGSIRLIDFGIAHRFRSSEGTTSRVRDLPVEEGIVGTPAYMSPEALRGEPTTRLTDVFSLGVVFHELLAGDRPFRGDTTLSVVAQILHSEPEPLAEAAPQTPPRLVAVIQRMLAKDPARRPSSAEELLEQLVSARRDSDSKPTERLVAPRPPRRMPGWKPVAAGLVLIAVLGGLLELNNPAYRIPVQRLLGMNMLPERRHVAVLPAETPGEPAQTAALGAGLVEFLGRQLMHLTGDSTLQVASPGLVRLYEVGDAPRARSEMGANLALHTRLETVGEGWRCRLTLTETRHDRTLATRTVQVGDRNAIGLAEGVVRESAAMLRLRGFGGRTPARITTGASGAFAAWLEGMGRVLASADTTDLLEGRAAFETARSIDPEFPRAAAGAARADLRLYEMTGEDRWLERARDESRRAVALDDSLPEAHLVLARVLARSGEPDGALAAYRRVVELDPLSEDGYYEMGRLQARRGEPAQAESVYAAAVEARPHAWPGYWWLGAHYLRSGRLEDAERMFRRLIAVSPENYRGLVNLGGLLVLSGHYAEGADILDRALELKHSNSALSNRATAHFNQRRFDRAIRDYQDAVAAGHSNHEIWGNLGDAFHWAPGKRELARPAYERALREGEAALANPDLSPRAEAAILAYLANILPKVDRPDSAGVFLDRAVAIDPEGYDVAYCAALVNWQLDRKAEALDWLERALEAGYPLVWIRDSPVFDDWREEPRFHELVSAGTDTASSDPNRDQGG